MAGLQSDFKKVCELVGVDPNSNLDEYREKISTNW